jgi:hypothetical protein
MEASQPIKPETQRPEPIIPPVAAHPHTEAASITGGYVYHGSRFPELRDAYIYGDYETGKIWALWHDGTQVTRREEIADTPHKIVSFGQSEDGELYWMNWEKDTRIYRLAPNPAVGKPSQFPRKLSETGLFTDTAAQTPAAGVLHPFEIAEPMWQDDAKAARFIAPARRAAHQVHPLERQSRQAELQGRVARRSRFGPHDQLETKAHRDTGPSLRWRDLEWLLLPLERPRHRRRTRRRGWRRVHHRKATLAHPRPRRVCPLPHNWSGFTLGFQPDQLVSISGKRRRAIASALFDGPFFERLKNRLISSHDDKSGDLESRARSWLHANCAHCHRRHGGGSVQLMVNADLPTAEAMLLDEKPCAAISALTDARVVAPGKPEQSVLDGTASPAAAAGTCR